MKISQTDRFQAIARNPRFIKLFDDFIEVLKKDNLDEAANKSDDLKKLFDLSDDELKYFLRIKLKKIDPDKEDISFSKPAIIPTNIKDLTTSYLFDLVDYVTISPLKDKILNASQNVLEKRFLLVKIDLLANDVDIVSELKTHLKKMRSNVKKDKSSNRKTKVDPWLVYDMHYDKKKNFSQITRELSGIEEHPSYNPTAKQWYNRVERAYQKAEKMINEVTPPNHK